jgi:hypothetical protein
MESQQTNPFLAKLATASKEQLEGYCCNKNAIIANTAAKQPIFTEEEINNLYKKYGDKIAIGIADNPHASPFLLEQLSHINNANIKAQIASNPNTHPKTLAKIARCSDDLEVLTKIANNPNTPEKVLKEILS